MEIGPSLPPHLLKKGKHTLKESEDTVGIGPSLPPHLLDKKQKREPSREEEEVEQEEASENDDVYGPVLPPHISSNKRSVPIGPALPPGMTNVATSEGKLIDVIDLELQRCAQLFWQVANKSSRPLLSRLNWVLNQNHMGTDFANNLFLH